MLWGKWKSELLFASSTELPLAFQMPSWNHIIPVYLWKAPIWKFLPLLHSSFLLAFVCVCLRLFGLLACLCLLWTLDKCLGRRQILQSKWEEARSVKDDRHNGQDAIRRSLLCETALAFLTGSLYISALSSIWPHISRHAGCLGAFHRKSFFFCVFRSCLWFLLV